MASQHCSIHLIRHNSFFLYDRAQKNVQTDFEDFNQMLHALVTTLAAQIVLLPTTIIIVNFYVIIIIPVIIIIIKNNKMRDNYYSVAAQQKLFDVRRRQ